MLEGGGKTPILEPSELEEIGFNVVVYSLSLIGVSIQAMQVRYLNLAQFQFGAIRLIHTHKFVDHPLSLIMVSIESTGRYLNLIHFALDTHLHTKKKKKKSLNHWFLW